MCSVKLLTEPKLHGKTEKEKCFIPQWCLQYNCSTSVQTNENNKIHRQHYTSLMAQNIFPEHTFSSHINILKNDWLTLDKFVQFNICVCSFDIRIHMDYTFRYMNRLYAAGLWAERRESNIKRKSNKTIELS